MNATESSNANLLPSYLIKTKIMQIKLGVVSAILLHAETVITS